MSWFAVDDRLPFHPKILRASRDARFPFAVTVWTMLGAYCTGEQTAYVTGEIPVGTIVYVSHLSIEQARDGAALLVEVGLWDDLGEDRFRFHDWSEWNGPDARQNRSREQARARKERQRLRDCEAGKHSKDCPPESCELKQKRRAQCEGGEHSRYCPRDCPEKARHRASRDAGTGRDGSGRAGYPEESTQGDWPDVVAVPTPERHNDEEIEP